RAGIAPRGEAATEEPPYECTLRRTVPVPPSTSAYPRAAAAWRADNGALVAAGELRREASHIVAQFGNPARLAAAQRLQYGGGAGGGVAATGPSPPVADEDEWRPVERVVMAAIAQQHQLRAAERFRLRH